jgi:hypothetical protein
MKFVALALGAVIAIVSMSVIVLAQGGISSADYSSCSGNLKGCIAGRSKRGESTAPCEELYRVCMRTGTWKGGGRHLTGIRKN